jgi:hypothetical protein
LCLALEKSEVDALITYFDNDGNGEIDYYEFCDKMKRKNEKLNKADSCWSTDITDDDEYVLQIKKTIAQNTDVKTVVLMPRVYHRSPASNFIQNVVAKPSKNNRMKKFTGCAACCCCFLILLSVINAYLQSFSSFVKSTTSNTTNSTSLQSNSRRLTIAREELCTRL